MYITPRISTKKEGKDVKTRICDDGSKPKGDTKEDGEGGAVYYGDANVFEGSLRESKL